MKAIVHSDNKSNLSILFRLLVPNLVALILLSTLLQQFEPTVVQADLQLSARLDGSKSQQSLNYPYSPLKRSQLIAPAHLPQFGLAANLAAQTLNQTGLNTYPGWVSDDTDASTYLAWGDVDGDGDLDLAVANGGTLDGIFPAAANTAIYLNENNRLQTTPIWRSPYDEEGRYVDWGDMDGDGDLDLAIATINRLGGSSKNRIFRNDGLGTAPDGEPMLLLVEAWDDPQPDFDTGAMSWGDLDGDGNLDLAVANGGWLNTEPSIVYRNDGLDGSQNIILTPVFTTPIAANSTAIAWGDMNNDGLLDLAIGNLYQPNRVYENVGGTLQYAPGLFGWEPNPGLDSTYSLNWGDIDRNGFLDLAVGNLFDENQIFLNFGGNISTTASWTDTLNLATARISLGDADNDGDLDLAVANVDDSGTGESPVTQVYVNNLAAPGTVSMTLGWEATVDAEQISGVAWGDVDSDGDLDLVTSIWPKPNLLYLNEASGLRETAVFSDTANPIGSLAWGDIDNDGDLDLAASQGFYRNQNGILTFESMPDMDGPIAWGDVNRDGYLDIAADSAIWINVPGPGGRTVAYDYDFGLLALDVAWADANNDGFLDLAIAGDETFVFYNDGSGELDTAGFWQPNDPFPTTAVSWGDVDNDGDLDLALGSDLDGKNQVYLNDNGVLDKTAAFTFGDEDDAVWDLDWGDVDNDGDLDIAVAVQDKPNLVFLNDNGIIRETPDWSSADIDFTLSIAWADVDGDGDLDLAVGNIENKPDKVYLNVNGTLNTAPIWQSADRDNTGTIAWGDVNGDGRLELATGSTTGLTLYAGQRPLHPIEFGPETAVSINSLSNALPLGGATTNALAPANGYAVPGIRSGVIPINYNLINQYSTTAHFVRAFFSPDGGGKWLPAIAAAGTQTTNLASSPTGVSHIFNWDVSQSQFFGQSDNMVVRIEAYFGASPATNSGPANAYNYTNAVPGPFQRPFVSDQTYPFRVRGTQIRVLDGNGDPVPDALVYRLPKNQILGAEPLVNTLNIPFRTNTFGYLQGRGQLAAADQLVALHPIAYGGATEKTLNFDGFDDYIDFGVVNNTSSLVNDFSVSAWVKLDRIGGIQRIVSHARSNSGDGFGFGIINNGLRFTTYGVRDYDSQTISLNPDEWYHVAAVMDVDNSVSFYVNGIYQETLFHPTPGNGNTDDKLLLGAISGFGGDPDNPFLFEYLNGSINDVRIWNEARSPAQIQAEMNGTLPQEDLQFLVGYWPINEGSGNFIEDQSGNDIIGELGGLNAAHPNGREPSWIDDDVPQDPTYIVYETSAAPTETGLAMTAVPDNLGIVTLTVLPTQSLTLFNLDVSLEWDARNDPTYLNQIQSDLKRTSQILFDLTNGQAALGDVTIFQNKDNWLDADVIVYATNSHRPNANLGGIVQQPRSEMVFASPTSTQKITVENAYLPGQIRMGSTWNRFGNTSGSLGEDWPRALAHEFGHYGFYLLDNYIGIRDGVLVETVCRGSAMFDAYVEREFLTDSGWTGECLDTLSEKTTGRSDWETIGTYYDGITATAVTVGPTNLPLNVTQIELANLLTETNTLATPFFGLLDDSGAPLVFGESEAQAYLFKIDSTQSITTYDDVIALGSPNRDLVEARGAEPGDRLCVYGTEPTRIGCHIVGNQESPFPVDDVTDWPPQIVATAENSRTFVVEVSNLANVNSLGVQIYPVFGTPSDEVITTGLGGETAVSVTVTLTDPSPGGYVRVWVPGSAPYKETLTQFYLGGGWNVNRPGLNVNRPGLNVNRPGLNVNRPGLNAPVASSDGQVIIFSLENLFDDVVTHSLQSLASLPDLDSWLTPVGQAYRFTADGDLPESSISFYYLQRDVPAGYEDSLAIYYQANSSDEWERLTTAPDDYRNLASATLKGEGTYVLAVTIVTPELREGWNLFAYPDTDTREVITALASIEGDYTSVYHWQPTNSPEWTLYDSTVLTPFQGLVNDLPTLDPLRSYWIYAMTDTVPYIGVPTMQNNQVANLSLPPATYYGEVLAGNGFTPTLGMTVEAIIDGVSCGTGEITNTAAGLSYKIQVAADNGNNCGTTGQVIAFVVDSITMTTSTTWKNMQANYLPLNGLTTVGGPQSQLFLPLIVNQASGNNAPDLVVTDISVSSSNIEVTIQNQGSAVVPVGSEFWVDVYFDPDPPPTAVNDIWQALSTEGVAWGVVSPALPLGVGESLTLSLNDSYFQASESNFSGVVAVGTAVYAQVDSANTNTNYGAVLESHEINGGSYNNILGPIISTTTLNVSRENSDLSQYQGNNLPPRQ